MSRSVDERVVQMEFDNAKFEAGAKQTMSTLEKLKEALSFDKSVGGLGKISEAVGNFNFHPIENSVEAVNTKFSAMETIAIGALLKIGSQAVSTGEQLIKSMSVDQISAGWDKFAKKTTSVGTLISQGFDMSIVEEQMERLNWFTDETSYNFTDMVDSIGKFTATGRGLEESVTAMEGIALWAAMSGQNAQKASSAMYQLSQAMSKGVLKYDDWKSISNASMDTRQFREQAIQAAVDLGVLKKAGDDTFKTLKGKVLDMNQLFSSEYMSKQAWFTSDVMMKVFKNYSSAVNEVKDMADSLDLTASEVIKAKEALDEGGESFDKYAKSLKLTKTETDELRDTVSTLDDFAIKAFRAGQEARTFTDVIESVKDAVSTGWMNTFENIFGNYEEAKELWTDLANELYDVFAESGNRRNEILAEWKELGGRRELIDAFWELFNAIRELVQPIKEVMREIFPEPTVYQLYNATRTLNLLARSMHLSEESANGLKTILRALLTPLKAIVSVCKLLLRNIEPIFNVVQKFVTLLISIGKLVATFALELASAIANTKEFRSILNSLVSIATSVWQIIKNLANAIGSLFGSFNGGGLALFERFVMAILKITDISLQAVAAVLRDIANLDFSRVKDFPQKFAEGLSKLAEENKVVGFLVDVLKALAGVLITAGTAVKEFVTSFVSKFKDIHSIGDLFDAIKDSAKEMLDKVSSLFSGEKSNKFVEWFNTVKTSAKKFATQIVQIVKDINPAEVLMVAFGVALAASMLKVTDALSKFAAVATSAKSLFDTLNGGIKKLFGISARMAELKEITVFIATLSLSLALLTKLDSAKLQQAAVTLGILGGGFIAFASALSFLNSKSLVKNSSISNVISMCVGISASLSLLAIALKILSTTTVDLKETSKAVLVVGELLGEVILAMAALKLLNGPIATSIPTILAISGSLILLAKALKEINDINITDFEGTSKLMFSIMTGFGLICAAAGNVKWHSFATILAIALALKQVVPVIQEVAVILSDLTLSDDAKGLITNLLNLVKMVVSLNAVVSVITAFTGKASKAKAAFSGFRNIATSFAMLAASVLILTVAMKQIVALLGSFSAEESLKVIEAGLIVSAIFGLLVIFAKNAEVASKSTNGVIKFAAAMLILSGAMNVMVVAIGYLAKLPDRAQDNILKAAAVIGALELVFAAMMWASQYTGDASIGVIIALLASVGVMITALGALALLVDHVDPLSIVGGIALLVIGLGALIGYIAAASKLSEKAKMGPLIAMTALLGVAIGGLIALNAFTDDILKLGVIAISLIGILATLALVADHAKGIDFKPLLAMAAMLVAAGAALSIALLTGANWYEMLAAAGSLAGIIVAVAAASKLAEQASALAMVELAAAVGIVAVSLLALTLVPWKVLLIATGILAGFIAVLVALGAIVGFVPPLIAGLAALSAAIAAISLSLAGLNLTIALVEAAGALLVGVITMFINAIKDFLLNADQMAVGILKLATAISSAILDINISISQGISVIAISVARGIDEIANSISAGFVKIGVGIGVGIASCIAIVIGSGAQVFSAGAGLTEKLKEGLKSKVKELLDFPKDTIKALLDKFKGNNDAKTAGEELGNSIVTGFRNSELDWHSPPGFLDKFANDCGISLDGMTDIFGGAGSAFGSELTSLFSSSTKDGLGGIVKEIIGNGGEFFNAGELLGNNLLQGFMNKVSLMRAYANGTVPEIWGIYKATNDAMAKSGKVVINSAEDYKKFKNSVKDTKKEAEETTPVINGLGESTGKAGKAAKEAKSYFDELSDTINNQMDLFSEFNQETDMSKDQLLKNMKSQLDGVAKWTGDLYSLSAKGLDQGLYKKLADMGPQGYKYVHAFTEMTREELAQANLYFATSLIFPSSGASNIIEGYAQAGNWASTGFMNGINPKAANEAAKQLAENTLKTLEASLEINSPSKKTYRDGKYTVEGYRNAIRDNADSPKNEIIIMATNVLNALKSHLKQQDFFKIGEDCVDGLKQGIMKKAEEAVTSIENLAKRMVTATKKIFDSHSPSKVFDHIGQDLDNGLIGGVKKKASDVLNTVKDVFGAVIDVADTDFDLNPVITPVLDLSDIQQNSGLIDGMLSDKTISFGADIVSDSRDPYDFMNNATMTLEANNSDVVRQLTELRADIGMLSRSMSKMQMVLDTGTLIGEISPGIDDSLGERAAYAGRGI